MRYSMLDIMKIISFYITLNSFIFYKKTLHIIFYIFNIEMYT